MQQDPEFVVEPFPFNLEIQDPVLYNCTRYLERYNTKSLHRAAHLMGPDVLIQSNFYLDQKGVKNALYSGFGGIEFTEQGKSFLRKFINDLADWFRSQAMENVELKLPVSIYQSDLDLLLSLLKTNGFKVRVSEVNQHIPISKVPFSRLIRKNERKKLRQCHEAEFKFKPLDASTLHLVYDIIVDTRLRRQFPVTMTLDKLKMMFDAFPDRYLLFGVYDEEKLIAVAVSIVVTKKVLYNFYHGDLLEYRSFSPLVMLLEGVYRFCQNHGFNFLDLGISSDQGVLNQGLFTFKANCGGQKTDKITMNLDLDYL